MNRRDFLHYTGAASLISSGIISPETLFAKNPVPEFDSFDELIQHLILLNDERIPTILDLQEKYPQSKHFGGVRDNWKIYNSHSTAGLIKTLATSFLVENSKYYRDETLV